MRRRVQRIPEWMFPLMVASVLLAPGCAPQQTATRTLQDSARACLERNDAREALRYLRPAIDQQVEALGPRDTSVASTLMMCASAFGSRKDFVRSDSAWAAALAIREDSLGQDHPMTWMCRHGWSTELFNREDFAGTITLLDPPLRDVRNGRPMHCGAQVTCLANWASAHYLLGRFIDADAAFSRCIAAFDRSYPDAVPDPAIIHTYYTWFLNDVGRHEEAVDHLRRLLDSCARRGEDMLYPYARFQGILGEHYHALGRLQDAEKAYLVARARLDVFTSGMGDPTVLADLGLLYLRMRRYDEAEANIRSALAVIPPGHSERARQLSNLADVLMAVHREDEAEAACRESVAIRRSKFGTVHPLVSRSLHRLGMVLMVRGRIGEADSLFAEAFRIGMDVLPPGEVRRVQLALWWARSSAALGRISLADSLMRMALGSHLDFLVRHWPRLTEKERVQLQSQVQGTRDGIMAHACARGGREFAGDLYDMVLADKAVIHQSLAMAREQILRSGDSALAALYRQWTDARALLARQARTSTHGVGEDSLARVVNALEERLLRGSSIFAASQQAVQVTWRDVRGSMMPDEAAVEIVRFTGHGARHEAEVGYAALVLRGGGGAAPLLVRIPHGDSLETTWLHDYHRLQTLTAKPAVAVLQREAWKRYWAPIAAELGGVTRIHLAADGVYHLINPGILSPDGRSVLMDRLVIHRTGSTRTLVSHRRAWAPARTAVLIGAPDFDAGVDTATGMRGRWQPLRSSLREVADIDSILRKAGWATQAGTGAEATKVALLSVRSPGVLHISTHGWFDDDTTHAQDPWLRELVNNERFHQAWLQAGLALAGANSEADPGGSEGSITAWEAATLDLRGTELVVLSACETGRGYIRNGEGVFGLQRAFQLAGARAILMSLWKVDDGVTRALMTEFYRRWLEYGDASEALREAVRALRSARPWLTPADWGAFVVME